MHKQHERSNPPPPYGEGLFGASVVAVHGTEDGLNPSPSRLALPSMAGTVYVEHRSILYLRAAGSYTHVHCMHGAKHLVSQHLHALEQHLPPRMFFRCHHSNLVNLTKVERTMRHADHRILLSSGETIAVARRRWAAL